VGLPVNVRPEILNDDLFVLTTETALLLAVIMVLSMPAPIKLIFLSLQETADDQVQEPAGIETTSPSAAMFTDACTSSWEQVTALITFADAHGTTIMAKIRKTTENVTTVFIESLLRVD
jgi:hypothetical protein